MTTGARLKFALLPLHRYISTPLWRQFFAAEDYFANEVMRMFDAALDEIERLVAEDRLRDGQYKFLCYLLSRPNISRDDVLIIAFSMFNDGLSKTAPAFMSGLWLLARWPEQQQKLYQEILAALPDGESQDITPEVLNKLPYVKAVMKETLRMYPIGTEVSRITAEDMELGGYLVPAGTHVDLNQWVHLRSGEWFPDPETFRPERWLRGQQQRDDVHPYMHIPFGHGTRMCAGRRFAEQDFFVTLVRLVQRFELQLTAGPQPPLRQVYETLLMPDAPVRIRFRRR